MADDLRPADRVVFGDPLSTVPSVVLRWLRRTTTHRNTWWMEVGCRAYEEDGDMRARRTTGGATGRRPSRNIRPGHRGLVAGAARVGILHGWAEGRRRGR